MKGVTNYLYFLFLAALNHEQVSAYSPNSISSRRQLFGTTAAICTSCLVTSSTSTSTSSSSTSEQVLGLGLLHPKLANAFDGSGASAYSGRNQLSKTEQRKLYQDRIVADVKDFIVLGDAIDKGTLEGDAWVNFFIQFQRREADVFGRTYAGLADLVGTKDVSGCGILLATSFAKPGKPADGIPAVKKYTAMAKTFDPIKAAGAKGDAKKAKNSWNNASSSLSEFLLEVGLPGSLEDPLYN